MSDDADDKGVAIREWFRRQVAARTAMPPAEAERRVYGIAQVQWREKFGEPVRAGVCPGCDKPASRREGIEVAEGVVVHDVECAIRYGRKWRGAAEAGLLAVGLAPPPGWE